MNSGKLKENKRCPFEVFESWLKNSKREYEIHASTDGPLHKIFFIKWHPRNTYTEIEEYLKRNIRNRVLVKSVEIAQAAHFTWVRVTIERREEYVQEVNVEAETKEEAGTVGKIHGSESECN